MLNLDTYLENMVEQNKLSHAYLFRSNPNVDNEHAVLKLINLINHSDYKTLDPEKISPNILILDDKKEENLKGNLIVALERLFKSSYSYDKPNILYIKNIDNAHNSFNNALLKTIEEAPSNSYIILTTNNYEKVIPTIKSRCQTLIVLPPSEDKKIEYLNEINYTGKHQNIYAMIFNNYEDLKKYATPTHDKKIDETWSAFEKGSKSIISLTNWLHTQINPNKSLFILDVLKCFFKATFTKTNINFDTHQKGIIDKYKKKRVPLYETNLVIDNFINRQKQKFNFTIAREILIQDLLNIFENKAIKIEN